MHNIMKYLQVLLILFALNNVVFVNAAFHSAAIAREHLITDLFTNYDAAAKPAAKDERIDVYVNIELQHFDYHETDGAFHFVGLLDASWRDPKLLWNPKFYNNLTRIPVNQKLVWVPDLEIYNNAPDKFLRMHRNGIAVLESTGYVVWTDAIDVTVFCTTKMDNWPHDQHVCKMSLGSWTYDGYELDILNAAPNTTMNFANIDEKSMEYQIVNYTAERVAITYQCCAEPYVTIDYYIQFQRRGGYAVIFRISALCIILLTQMALLMEPWRTEKLWLNAISLILIVLKLIYFATIIGRFARGTPYIVIYYSCCLVLVTINHLVCVFSLFATRSHFKMRLPARCLRLLKSPLISFIASAKVQHRSKQSDRSPLHSQFEDVKLQECSNLIGGDSQQNEWLQIATILERIAFIAFSVIHLILATSCLV